MSGTLFPPSAASLDTLTNNTENHLKTGSIPLGSKPFHSSPNLILSGGFPAPNGVGVGAKRRGGKRVVFADDRGFQLVTIRVMSEPSDVPPVLNFAHLMAAQQRQQQQQPVPAGSQPVRFFDGNTTTLEEDDGYGSNGGGGDDTPPPPVNQCDWAVRFRQPASDYLAFRWDFIWFNYVVNNHTIFLQFLHIFWVKNLFRQKVDRENVALENVLIKNDLRRLTGTVKVKNLGFEKSVSLRLSFDNWRSFTDHTCRYKQHRASHSNSVRTGDLFDTFEFDLELEPEKFSDDEPERTSAQFCIRFWSPQGEFWDSNGGENYSLVNERLARQVAALSLAPGRFYCLFFGCNAFMCVGRGYYVCVIGALLITECRLSP